MFRKAVDHGAGFAGYTVLRLPHSVKSLFAGWLGQHYPNKTAKVLNRVRSMRGGNLNDPRFGSRMKGEGPHARQIASLFQIARRRAGIEGNSPSLSTGNFVNPLDRQLPLFP